MTGLISDDQLEEIVRALAKAHLEVERGLRPHEALAEMMPPSARHAWLTSRRNQPPLTGGAVDKSDITITGVERHASGRVYATAITPTHQDRRGAICFVLSNASNTSSVTSRHPPNAAADDHLMLTTAATPHSRRPVPTGNRRRLRAGSARWDAAARARPWPATLGVLLAAATSAATVSSAAITQQRCRHPATAVQVQATGSAVSGRGRRRRG